MIAITFVGRNLYCLNHRLSSWDKKLLLLFLKYFKIFHRITPVAALPQTVPEFDHAQGWIPAAHIADELQLGLCVLVGVAVGPSGLAGQGRHTTIPALLPEVDVRPALVVLPAGAADAVFLCVLH